MEARWLLYHNRHFAVGGMLWLVGYLIPQRNGFKVCLRVVSIECAVTTTSFPELLPLSPRGGFLLRKGPRHRSRLIFSFCDENWKTKRVAKGHEILDAVVTHCVRGANVCQGYGAGANQSLERSEIIDLRLFLVRGLVIG